MKEKRHVASQCTVRGEAKVWVVWVGGTHFPDPSTRTPACAAPGLGGTAAAAKEESKVRVLAAVLWYIAAAAPKAIWLRATAAAAGLASQLQLPTRLWQRVTALTAVCDVV